MLEESDGVYQMQNIKLSVLDASPILQGTNAEAALGQSVLLAQTAERLGYFRYWATEHHDMEMMASAAPEVLLSHVGALTKTIRIGSGAVLLPHYKPIKIAEIFRLLSALYPGRVDLGVGRAPGGSAHVTMALNDNFLEQVRHFPESLKTLIDLLSEAYRLDNQPVIARPIPAIPPELWLLGTNVKSAGYAAEHGTGYVFGQFMSDADGFEIISAYRDSFRPSALCPYPKTIAAVGAVCAETEAEARRLAAQGAGKLFKLDDHALYNQRSSSNKLIAGNPEQVMERLLSLQEKWQVDEFLVMTFAPDYESRLRSYELLAQSL